MIFDCPTDDYTVELLAAVPNLQPGDYPAGRISTS